MLRSVAKHAFSHIAIPSSLVKPAVHSIRNRRLHVLAGQSLLCGGQDGACSRQASNATTNFQTRPMRSQRYSTELSPPRNKDLTREHGANDTALEQIDRLHGDPMVALHWQINSEYSGEPSQDVHIIGRGNIGKLLGFSLARIQSQPYVKFLLNRKDTYDHWLSKGAKIRANFQGIERQVSQIELEYQDPGAENSDIIKHLVVCVKAPEVASRLAQIKHRLDASSTVLFIQNGMGFIDEVSEKVFPDPSTRPTYAIGIVTHGVRNLRNRWVSKEERDKGTNNYSIFVTRGGDIKLAYLPREDGALPKPIISSALEKTYLLRCIERAVNLQAEVQPLDALTVTRYQKLAANAVINPLTGILGCPNGALLGQRHVTPIIRKLISEVSAVLSALPELQTVEDKESFFSEEALELYIVDLIGRTRVNTSSMLQDLSGAGRTEIMYINGYILKRAAELGIAVPNNEMMISLVQTKSDLKALEYEYRAERRERSQSSDSEASDEYADRRN